MERHPIIGIVIGAVLGANMGKMIGMILWLFVWGDGVWPSGASEIVQAMDGVLGSTMLSTIFAIVGAMVNRRFIR